ncbi:MAG: sugar phosphate isomerase/epimerase, partial [Clostridia bacterium]|nr:sugar phosphate isomerase/epimerase [Clostridia bacterium]
MEIGVQLYTLRRYAQSESGLSDVFKKVREMGYGVVQYSGCPAFPEEIKTETIKKIADDNGVR